MRLKQTNSKALTRLGKRMDSEIIERWKDEKNYEYLKGFGQNEWAWEFLRRNPQYKKEWHEINKLPSTQKRKLTDFSWEALLAARKSKLSPLKWGLAGYSDPDITDATSILFAPLIIPGDQPNAEEGKVLWPFDLTFPINPQIENAKTTLLWFQENISLTKSVTIKFKPRLGEFKLLIRILDAEASGAQDNEIAKVLSSVDSGFSGPAGIKKVYDKKKQAKRYVNGEYKLLVHSYKRSEYKGLRRKLASVIEPTPYPGVYFLKDSNVETFYHLFQKYRLAH